MTKNVHPVDRALRLVLAIVLAVLAFNAGLGSTSGVIFSIFAITTVATAGIGLCPIYRILGVNTCRLSSPSRR
jgi:NADH:ubiquinone oxidoreductase subunit K